MASVPSPSTLPLAVSIGDPAGIGPDIIVQTWANRTQNSVPPFLVAGAVSILTDRAQSLGLNNLPVQSITDPSQALACFTSSLPVIDLAGSNVPFVQMGKPSTAYARFIIEALEQAAHFAIKGEAAALVTCPISKDVLLSSGFAHPGHTEFLGELAVRAGYHNATPVMLMASGILNVVPITVHIALQDVPRALTQERIMKAALITHQDFKRFFGMPSPRIAVCGLNPHAGENGKLGCEERDTITPAIEALKAQGLTITGPFSADTLFHGEARSTYDVVLAMYHDQALIPFKTLAFEDGVNVTLGLPFIRTSPDHGTAFALAGTGRARPTSFIAALKQADRMHKQNLLFQQSKTA